MKREETLKANKTNRTAQEARAEEVVADLVEAIRGVLVKRKVTFEEYRKACTFLTGFTSEPAYEVPLMCDIFFNGTVCDVESKERDGSATSVEGPYFLEDVPEVTEQLPVRDHGVPFVMKGKVSAVGGGSVAGAKLYIWHSDPDGYYSGYDSEFPKDYYRGVITLDDSGEYSVKSTLPAAYTIPLEGISNKLLSAMGRHPWRPAHIHYKVLHPDYAEYTTQAHFEGFEFNDNDCVEAVRAHNLYALKDSPDGKILEADFVLDPLNA